MEKCPTPNLPTTKHIVEDIFDPTFIFEEYPRKLAMNDEQLNNAFSCFINFKQLEGDMKKQSELNCKLEELNKKLVENIASFKSQAAKK